MKGGLGQYVYFLCSIGIHKWQLVHEQILPDRETYVMIHNCSRCGLAKEYWFGEKKETLF